MNKIIKFDSKYYDWIKDLSSIYKNKLSKINININYEMLELYWIIGKKVEEIKNGLKKVPNGFYERISFDLKEIFKNIKGISETNINYMNRFYNNYKEILEDNIESFPPNVGGNLSKNLNKKVKNINERIYSFKNIKEMKKVLFSIPWGHQKILIDKVKNDYEKIFYYVDRILYDGWNRDVLNRNIKNDILTNRKIAINNFSSVLKNEEIKVIENITKDPYVFDFLSLSEDFSEKELKDKLVLNIKLFLLELGKGYAFVGQEKRLKFSESELFTDLLFFHIPTLRYVVIEVKLGKFKPEFLSQLSTYVAIVDEVFKSEKIKSTIGILICEDGDEGLIKISSSTIKTPIAISKFTGFNINKEMPEIKKLENFIKEKKLIFKK